jgi:ferredoxin-NADP reductase
MQKELQPSSQVWIKLPFGEFIMPADRALCLLAGGTGVTAFTAFLGGLTAEYPHPVELFYGARHPGLLIYRPVVESAVQNCPRLRVHYFAEQHAEEAGCHPGVITARAVLESLTIPLDYTYYLAGPPAMLHNLVPDLQQAGVPADRIVIDAWE